MSRRERVVSIDSTVIIDNIDRPDNTVITDTIVITVFFLINLFSNNTNTFNLLCQYFTKSRKSNASIQTVV